MIRIVNNFKKYTKHLEFKIDKKKIHKLKGIVHKSQFLGIVNDVPVTIGTGGNSDIISDEFSYRKR